MICPKCRAEVVLRTHSVFMYQREAFDVGGDDLEAVLASCPLCRVPVILLRRGKGNEVDGLWELAQIESEEVVHPT